MTEPLLSTAEAASILNRPERTVTRWAKKGDLPVAYRGKGQRGVLLFNRDDVIAKARQLIAETRIPTIPEKDAA